MAVLETVLENYQVHNKFRKEIWGLYLYITPLPVCLSTSLPLYLPASLPSCLSACLPLYLSLSLYLTTCVLLSILMAC